MQSFNPYAATSPPGQPSDDLSRVPKAPRNVSPAARQLVVNLGAGGWVLLLVGSIFAFVGTITTVGLCGGLPGDLALSLSPTLANGVVTSVSTVTNVTINHAHPRALAFTYTVAGTDYTGTSSSMTLPTGSHTGSAVVVEYLSYAPSVARVEGTTRAPGGGMLAFPLIFPLVGYSLLLVPILGYRRRRRAFVHGTPTIGWITSFGPNRRVKVNGRNPTMLEWSFESPRGRGKGSVSAMNASLFGERRVGAPVIVLFDPKNPRVNTLWVE